MLNVMVVEDEKIIRQGIVNLVKRYGKGFDVRWECANAMEAWNAFQAGAPDLLITDIIMKGMTGLELIRRVRENGSDVPIVVLSGFSEFSYAQTALRYNVTDYLLKPVDIKEFSQVLERIQRELAPAERSALTGDVANADIRHAVKWMDEHLSEDLSQQNVAEQVGLSVSYLSVLFKQQMGVHYSEYLFKRRMEKAREFLRSSDLCIYEIARLCGYRSDKHFINVFKREAGVTPSQYRNKAK